MVIKIIIAIIFVALLAGALCIVFKAGKAEGICKYGYKDEDASGATKNTNNQEETNND